MEMHTNGNVKGRSAVLALALLLLTAGAAAAQTNGTMMQYFHWYNSSADNLWLKVSDQADELAAAGITALWLPPAYKAINGGDVGYGVYDLYDLGEFNQKGSVRTKYGTRAQYLAAIGAAHANGLQVYGDVVFNHKGGADFTEWVTATRVQTWDRNIEYGGDFAIQAWTGFDFPGRGNTYSAFKWRWYHFDGVDWDENLKENGKIYKFRGTGKAWDWRVHDENGNYDYLMHADLDLQHPDVVNELKSWGVWYVNSTGVDGLRLDALKHVKYDFWNGWLDHVRNTTGKPLFTVGELWSYDVQDLHDWLTDTGGRAALFDAPLHLNFFNASRAGGGYDMRDIMDNTLMEQQPAKAVTLVENHDTQPLQALESPVMDWFKPLAYAFILLRAEGYPSVFYPDYYGATYTDKGQTITIASQKAILDKLLDARKNFAYGTQNNYLDHWDVIGWTRLGNAQHPRALAVILTDGPGGSKPMNVGKANARFFDHTANRVDVVTTNGSGWGSFPVNGGSVSVWVQEDPNQVSVQFTCNNGQTVVGQDVYVTGSVPQLGNWDTSKAVKLSPVSYPSWSGWVPNLAPSTQIQWKCIKKQGANVAWQPGGNNVFTTPASGSTTATGSF
jgi:alpha-amylase